MKFGKKFFVLLMVGFLCVLNLASVFASSNMATSKESEIYEDDLTNDENVKTEDFLTVDSYKSWLNAKMLERTSNNAEFQNFLNEYNALTEEQQELFVSYLNDPDLLSIMINEMLSGENDTILNNGDIVISTNNNEMVDSSSKSAIQNRIASFTKSGNILGITIVQYSGELRYSHNGTKITSINAGNVWISQNYIPFTSYNFSSPTQYGIGSNTATHIQYCTWNFAHPKFGITPGTHQIGITGNIYNSSTYWID